jgi:uncharacterized membrane protein YbaN (DUF454 family)
MGFLFLGVGVIGIFLPLLPATPFVLLAAACFARSSEKWHRWMLANETFGPMIRNWEQNRCITCRVKMIAIASMVFVGGFSIFYAVESTTARAIGGFFLTLGLVTVSVIKTCNGKVE